MKLLNKTSKYYIVAALSVFIIGSTVFYFAVGAFVNNDIVGKLYEEKNKIEKQIALLDSVPQLMFSAGDDITIIKVPGQYLNSTIQTKDTTLVDENDGEVEVSRLIRFYAKSKFNTYYITINKSLVENDDLIEAIAIALFTLIISFLIVLYFINRRLSKFIWKPFYHSLNKIKQFDVANAQSLDIAESSINEFNELNKAVSLMTDKIQADYKNLKEFTENASHEIQTPLAIIKTKLELLIQNENLKEEDMLIIQAVYDATNRLSKLNQSLILLTKIENNQFAPREKVNVTELLKKQIDNYSELISAKNLTLNSNIQNDVLLNINPALADVLFTNLITNAIKHNISKGEIKIELSSEKLTLSNTGQLLESNPAELFERFKKDKSSSESLGLGLSIVKKICATQHYEITYSFQNNYHTLELVFLARR
jgi:signal transduction histidine kinase